MDVSLDWRKRARVVLLGLALGAGVVACGEDLESGAACPVLCPGQNLTVFDTTFDAVSFDTTVSGIPGFGTEASMYLATRGDTLDVRGVVRFDSLPSTFQKASADSAITRLDSAYVLFAVNATATRVRGSVRIDLFDVDTADADTVNAVVASLFRPDRLIGGTTFDSAQVKDSIKVYLDKAKLLAKVTGKQRLRLGVKATSATGAEVELGTIEGGRSSLLRFDPAPEDTAIKALTVAPTSSTPPGDGIIAGDYLDYTLVVAAPPAPTGALLSVGGLPNRRGFLRFDVPSRILDSSTVLRASLIFTQQPNRGIGARDTLALVPEVSLAGEDVTDLTRAALLLGGFAFDTLRVAPGDSGTRVLEVATALRQWAAMSSSTIKQQRAIVLRSTREATSPFDVHISSREAPPALRPRLRVNYALRSSFGIP
ncbi:MAG: hypothetical protein AMXMBFR55_20220 [Gemmatimonadota bacterium]